MALEGTMDPLYKDTPLAAAAELARRVLISAMDIHFDLDDAIETAGGRHELTPRDLEWLRADAITLQREIERLAASLWPAANEAELLLEEEEEAIF
jgi:hypothetical protein